MCGINGVIHPADEQESRRLVGDMCAAMAHRGPDAQGIWSDHQVVLGHRRLSIIDTSAAGNQPFASADGRLVIAFNGEIYNYLELRNELKGHHDFRTDTDTEVLLAAYKHWGIAMTERLFGMFAFVLYDLSTGEVHVVRDRMGVKPLYYIQTAEGFLFASEIRSLLATGKVKRRLDPIAVQEYLMYQTVQSPRTIIRDVQMLQAGHRLILANGQCTETCYWNPLRPPIAQVHGMSRTELLSGVRERLSRAVAIRMRADVPFGAFLSGGIDSSAIVGLMAEVSSQPVKTFSITFDEKEWDESSYSQLIARRFATDHHEIRLSASHFRDEVPAAIGAMDHPSGDGPNTYVVSKVTREAGVKMALSGIGGDELFAGYDVFKRLHRLEQRSLINAIPRAVRSAGGKLFAQLRPSAAADKIAATLATPNMRWFEVYPLVRAIYGQEQINRYLKAPIQGENAVAMLCRQIEATELPLLSKISLAESNTYLQNVLLRDSDQMSMAHALEVREPFLDHDLIEWVLAINDQEKYPHFPKQLLVEAMGDLLPSEIVHRPKMGFTFPWAQWMKNELKPYCEEGLHHLQQHPFFDPKEIDAAWKQFCLGNPKFTWSRLWPMVVLGQWIRINEIEMI